MILKHFFSNKPYGGKEGSAFIKGRKEMVYAILIMLHVSRLFDSNQDLRRYDSVTGLEFWGGNILEP